MVLILLSVNFTGISVSLCNADRTATAEMSRHGSGVGATAIAALSLIMRGYKKFCGHRKYI